MNMKPFDKHTAMRKRIITIVVAVLMSALPAMSQVFIMEDDESMNRPSGDGIVFNVMVPTQDTNIDQYVPLVGGLWALSGMAGLYLLGRRRHRGDVTADNER